MIIITSQLFVNMTYTNPGLVAKNVKITNNTCGTISYWITSELKVVNIIPNVSQYNDKMSGLLIDNNVCHYINNADSTGIYFFPQLYTVSDTTSRSDYPSGRVVISNNKCNWIHVANVHENESSLIINKNTLTAYNTAYLTTYNEGLTWTHSAITQNYGIDSTNTYNKEIKSKNYAIFVAADPFFNLQFFAGDGSIAVGSDSSCIISENITDFGYYLQNSLATTYTDYYYGGYIYTMCSSNITNNILKGIEESSGKDYLILLGGLSNIVTNNKIYRYNNTIFAYVGFGVIQNPGSVGFTGGSIYGTNTKGIVTNNYFDQYTIDNGSNTNLISLNDITTNTFGWILKDNINQTGFILNPMTRGAIVGRKRDGLKTNIYPSSCNEIYKS